MKNLYDYLFKTVIIEKNNGDIYKGYVDLYEDEEDSGYNEPSIGVYPNENAKFGIELKLSEIKSIKIIG